MTRTQLTECAQFETTRRLLACLINEGLVDTVFEASPSQQNSGLHLQALSGSQQESSLRRLRVALDSKFDADASFDGNNYPIAPEYLTLPVRLENKVGDIWNETSPSKILQAIQGWICCSIADGSSFENATRMLQNSAENQEKWLRLYAEKSPCDLNSAAIDWENTIISGHPEHPLHRCFFPESPLLKPLSADLDDLLTPELSFISFPTANLHIAGQFHRTIEPLLEGLGIPSPACGQTIIPCFTRQLPLIFTRLPEASLVRSIQGIADTQVSARTVSIKPNYGFNHHLKMSLSYQITGAIRNIKPRQVRLVTYITSLLERLVHPNLWIYREVATVTGAQPNMEEARLVSCILREDLESRATAENESLIIAAALYQRPARENRTYAEVLFGLDNVVDKRRWFQRYIALLFQLVVPLLARGVVLEAHSQNIIVRVSRRDASLTGFAIRDMNGLKIHVPTLESQGIHVPAELARRPETQAKNPGALWQRLHRTLLQNHVAFLLRSLGLEQSDGWATVREELGKVLVSHEYPMGDKMRESFFAETMEYPCFLGAILRGKPLEVEGTRLPNIILR